MVGAGVNSMSDSLKFHVLKLHSLSDNEKHWILNKLSSVELNRVEVLLSEVTVINNVYDKTILSQSLHHLLTETELDNSSDDEIKGKISLQKLIKKVDKLEAEKVCNLLESEEAWILSQVIKLNQWTWLEDLKNRLSASKKEQTQQHINRIGLDDQLHLLIILLKLIVETINNYDMDKSAQSIISYDEFSEFQLIDTNKNWWRDLWHS